MKFTRYKRKPRKQKHSEEYIRDLRAQLYRNLANAKSPMEEWKLIEAYRITVNP